MNTSPAQSGPCEADDSLDKDNGAELRVPGGGVLQDAPEACTVALSRKDKRRLAKKAKRKRARIQVAEEAKKKAEQLAQTPSYQKHLLEQQAAAAHRQRLEDEQHRRDEAQWLERERVLAAAAAEKEKAASLLEKEVAGQREQPIKVPAEPEAAQPLGNQQAASPQAAEVASEEEVDGPSEIIWEGNQIIVRKRKVKKSEAEAAAKEDGPTHNPLYIQLPDTAALLAQAEADADKREVCQFFMRTGACRHFDKCSRKHPYPLPSHVIMIRGMFTALGPPGVARKEDDASLEHTEAEIDREFEEFYEDVLPEFEAHGVVTNFKVCQNTCAHLRGNVYVSYKEKEAAVEAFRATHGRFYGGKQLVCEYAPFTHWRSAICGIQRTTGRCQHGGGCNYLHCFRNPGGAFAQADFAPVDQPGEAGKTPCRERSRSVDTVPGRRSSRRDRSPSKASDRDGYDERYGRHPHTRRGGRERSPSNSQRNRERERVRSPRRSRDGRSWRKGESRSPVRRRNRSRDRGVQDREVSVSERPERVEHRDRSEDAHGRSERRGGWRRSRSREVEEENFRKRRWHEDERWEGREKQSGGRESARGYSREESDRGDLRVSQGRGDGTEGWDRWQAGDKPMRGDEPEVGRDSGEHIGENDSKKGEKEGERKEGSEPVGEERRRKHRKKKKRREKTDDLGPGEPETTPEETPEAVARFETPDRGALSQAGSDEKHWQAFVERATQTSGPVVKAAGLIGTPEIQKQGSNEARSLSGSATGDAAMDLEKRLFELRKAVEQSLRERRPKNARADAEGTDRSSAQTKLT